jgi:hypothetical protein
MELISANTQRQSDNEVVGLLINRFGCKVGKVRHSNEMRQNKNEKLLCNLLKVDSLIMFFYALH